MYTIVNKGRRLQSLGVFDSYEQARNALRKHIRKLFNAETRLRRDSSFAELDHYNPSIRSYTYQIKRT